MLWVLPINVPVLIVWAHNLAVHWFTPFSSHHNVLSIMPFILLVQTLTNGAMIPRNTTRYVVHIPNVASYLKGPQLMWPILIIDFDISPPSSSSSLPYTQQFTVFHTRTFSTTLWILLLCGLYLSIFPPLDSLSAPWKIVWWKVRILEQKERR